ncbi:hypothetical protein GCM10009600_28310 [Oerskovia paurometabola]
MVRAACATVAVRSTVQNAVDMSCAMVVGIVASVVPAMIRALNGEPLLGPVPTLARAGQAGGSWGPRARPAQAP